MIGKLLLTVAFASFLSSFSLGKYNPDKLEEKDTTVIVELDDKYGDSEEARERSQKEFLSKLNGVLKYNYSVKSKLNAIGNYVILDIPGSTFDAIRAIDGVDSVWYDVTYDTAEYDSGESQTYTFNPSQEKVHPDHNYSRDTMNAPSLDDDSYAQGEGTVVAILDNGFELTHPVFTDLADDANLKYSESDVSNLITTKGLPGKWYNNKIIYYYDQSGNDTDVFNPTQDHGIHVSSIAGGNQTNAASGTPNYTGIAPNAQMVLLKVFPDGNSGASDSDIMPALDTCLKLDVDVVNMSLGSALYENPADRNAEINGDTSVAFGIIRKLVDQGISVSISAGNDGRASFMVNNDGAGGNTTNYGPYGEGYSLDNVDGGIIGSYASSIYGTIIASGRVEGDTSISRATSYLKYVSSFSSDGPTYDLHLNPDIITPGENVWGADNTRINSTNFVYMDGTSMAAPNYAGAYANILSNGDWQDITDEEQKAEARQEYRKTLKARIQSTADPYVQEHSNSTINGSYYSVRKQGAGLVNILDAINSDVYFKGVDKTTGTAIVNESAEIELGNDENMSKGIFDFSITGINESNEAKKYTATLYVEAPVVSQYTEGDTSKDYASLFDTTIDKTYTQEVTLQPGENTLSFHHELTDEAKTYLEQFPEGTYVEGYLVFTPVDENDTIDLSMPFLGFYGDYSQAAPAQEFDFAREDDSMLGGDELLNLAYDGFRNTADFTSTIYTSDKAFTDSDLTNAAYGSIPLSSLPDTNNAIIDEDTGNLVVGIDGLSSNIAIQQVIYRSILNNSVELIDSEGQTVYKTVLRGICPNGLYGSENGMLMKSLIVSDTNSSKTSNKAYSTIEFRKNNGTLVYPAGLYTLKITYTLFYNNAKVVREYGVEVRDAIASAPTHQAPVVNKDTTTNTSTIRFNVDDNVNYATSSDGWNLYPLEVLEDEVSKYILLDLANYSQRDKIYIELTNIYNLSTRIMMKPSLIAEGQAFYVEQNGLNEGYLIDLTSESTEVVDNKFTTNYSVSITDARGQIVSTISSYDVGLSIPYNALLPEDMSLIGDYISVSQVNYNGSEEPIEFTISNGMIVVNTSTGRIKVQYTFNPDAKDPNAGTGDQGGEVTPTTPSEGVPGYVWGIVGGVGGVIVIGVVGGLIAFFLKKKK